MSLKILIPHYFEISPYSDLNIPAFDKKFNLFSLLLLFTHCWQHKSCSFVVRLTNITFGTRTPKEFGVWLHLAGVYYGASIGGGIAFYRDWALVARNTTLTSTPSVTPASGKLVLGRKRSELTGKYASIEVDEILLFNRKLSGPEVQMIYNATRN